MMKKITRRDFLRGSAAGMVGVFLGASLTGCGSSEGSSSGGGTATADTTFTFWLYTTGDAGYYDSYSDNPAVQYLLSKTWGEDDATLAFDFWVPASGSASDNFSTMIGSGDYADIIENTIGDTASTYYNDGVIIDLTDYVQEYMPNYLAYLEENPELQEYAVTKLDGEDKYLGIINLYDEAEANYWGHCYRRDWIVKYGTNPETGEAFTGGFTDADDVDSWTDDVVFPSGGSDPVYISDWEWMFEIFTTAMEDLGITDGYCYTVPYNGYLSTGELSASFGGGASGYWFRTLENEVRFGPITSEFKAYLQCVSTWYANGWIDTAFDERTSDMFYMIDSTKVYQGKVGMWYGLQSQLGGRMDSDDELTSGIFVAGAATPINDIYGEDENQYQEPYCGFANSKYGTTYIITAAAKDKDIPTLLTFFDYLYTTEGAEIRSLGLNAEQTEELGSDLLTEMGLEDGCYTVDEDGTYVLEASLANDSDKAGAVRADKLPGLMLVANVENGYADSFQASLDRWDQYPNLGYIMGAHFLEYVEDDDLDTYNNTATKIEDYMAENAPKFIKGELDVNGTDWDNWVTILGKYGVNNVTEILQTYADLYPISTATSE